MEEPIYVDQGFVANRFPCHQLGPSPIPLHVGRVGHLVSTRVIWGIWSSQICVIGFIWCSQMRVIGFIWCFIWCHLDHFGHFGQLPCRQLGSCHASPIEIYGYIWCVIWVDCPAVNLVPAQKKLTLPSQQPPQCSGAGWSWKQSLKAAHHILGSIVEIKQGQLGINLHRHTIAVRCALCAIHRALQ